MVTVNLTMDEAQAVAGAMRELIERSGLNELMISAQRAASYRGPATVTLEAATG